MKVVKFHRCITCGEYTPEDKARYLGVNEYELWLCPDCDDKTWVPIKHFKYFDEGLNTQYTEAK